MLKMLSTLEKVQCLEAYVAMDGVSIDSVLDKSLTKLLTREYLRTQHLTQRLREELRQFEQTYHLLSEEFYISYGRGEMGDAMDFIEWAATFEMLMNAEKRMAVLDIGT